MAHITIIYIYIFLLLIETNQLLYTLQSMTYILNHIQSILVGTELGG